ncbi:hypothetical protein EDL98_04170 [Ornithobacterium rhinotracheale]|uniref:hypothetical protein n=1 Tax=Ornithobacterium rhinotracheale TaxID=28251 RepID=UPI00129CF6E7|nr:hypothetical protein [Ornithobacterium rhinotracheale]MRJ10275.1 hypothetical protein [Ornithobacterium rhinotracheale]
MKNSFLKIIMLIFLSMSVVVFGQKKSSGKKARVYSEKEALAYIQDYFSFYKSDCILFDTEFRRKSRNVFDVKTTYCCQCGSIFNNRNIEVSTLTIYPKGKYTLTMVSLITSTAP